MLDFIEGQMRTVEWPPADFYNSLGANFVLTWAVFGFSHLISPSVWGKSIKPVQHIYWHATGA